MMRATSGMVEGMMRTSRRGNCYVASEAMYHILGGKAAGWKPMRLKCAGDCHWFLQHTSGMIVDPCVMQFDRRPPYHLGIGCGFLTKQPSKRARALMEVLTWQ